MLALLNLITLRLLLPVKAKLDSRLPENGDTQPKQ
jgi:hypothetical protein